MININFSNFQGTVVFDDFNINSDIPLAEQLDELKEDMLQVEFPDNYILDIGWRPSFDPDGSFHVVLIKEFDWENPKYTNVAKDMAQLKLNIQSALAELNRKNS